jgi:hypothetical protein
MCKHNLALIYSVSIWGNSEIYTLNNKKCSKNCKSSTICLGDVLVINRCNRKYNLDNYNKILIVLWSKQYVYDCLYVYYASAKCI